MDAGSGNDIKIQVANLQKRLQELERIVDEQQGGLVEAQKIRRELDQIAKHLYGDSSTGTLGLVTIVHGSSDLGVESLRAILNRINTSYDRLRWLIGIIGLPSIVAVITWIISIVKSLR